MKRMISSLRAYYRLCIKKDRASINHGDRAFFDPSFQMFRDYVNGDHFLSEAFLVESFPVKDSEEVFIGAHITGIRWNEHLANLFVIVFRGVEWSDHRRSYSQRRKPVNSNSLTA